MTTMVTMAVSTVEIPKKKATEFGDFMQVNIEYLP
jgi:hypothetical protein